MTKEMDDHDLDKMFADAWHEHDAEVKKQLNIRRAVESRWAEDTADHAPEPMQQTQLAPFAANDPATVPPQPTPRSEKRKNPYELLAEHAKKHWAMGTDNYKLASCLKGGQCDYQTMLDILVPNCKKRTEPTKRFHAVKGVVNAHLAANGQRIEVFRDGEQVILRKLVSKNKSTKSKV